MGFGLTAKTQTKLKTRIGLDIGTSSVKMIEITADPTNKLSVSAFAFKNVFGFSRQEVSDSIRAMFAQAKTSSREVSISVSGPSLIVRFIQMPAMDKDALKGAIRFEAEKFIPFDVNDCVIDFQVLSKDEKERKLNILLVAAKKDNIKDKMKVVEEAGLSINVIGVDSFAMANSFFNSTPSADKSKTYAVLNIGASLTNLIITREGALYFARDVAIGGNEINNEIAKKLGIDKRAAEAMKLDPKEKAADVMACSKAVLTNIFDDVKLSFGYYENQSGKAVDEVYIAGGGVKIPGLDEIFAEVFGAKPSIWDPIASMNTAEAGVDSKTLGELNNYFSVASGLALR